MHFTFCRCISRTDLDYFEQKIESWRSFINQHCAHIHITPKFHYVVHYATMMARYGPLRDLWCMRYEAKHQYFKALSKSLGNFINIALSLASRHQMKQAYRFSGNEVIGQDINLPNVGKHVSLSQLPAMVQQYLCHANNMIWSVSEAVVCGCKYVVGAALIIDFTSDGNPIFLLVKHILLVHYLVTTTRFYC